MPHLTQLDPFVQLEASYRSEMLIERFRDVTREYAALIHESPWLWSFVDNADRIAAAGANLHNRLVPRIGAARQVVELGVETAAAAVEHLDSVIIPDFI